MELALRQNLRLDGPKLTHSPQKAAEQNQSKSQTASARRQLRNAIFVWNAPGSAIFISHPTHPGNDSPVPDRNQNQHEVSDETRWGRFGAQCIADVCSKSALHCQRGGFINNCEQSLELARIFVTFAPFIAPCNEAESNSNWLSTIFPGYYGGQN